MCHETLYLNAAEPLASHSRARVFNGVPLRQAPSGVPTKRSPVKGWFITPTAGCVPSLRVNRIAERTGYLAAVE